MHQGSRLQSVTRSLTPEIFVRQTAEFRIDQGQEFVPGRLVAVPPIQEESGYFMGCRHWLLS